MGVIRIKALKDIPIQNGELPPIPAGQIADVGSDYAKRYIDEGLAELVKVGNVVTSFPVPEILKNKKTEI